MDAIDCPSLRDSRLIPEPSCLLNQLVDVLFQIRTQPRHRKATDVLGLDVLDVTSIDLLANECMAMSR